MDCTPRIALLATRLQELSTELNKNLDTLSKKLGISLQPIREEVLVLEAAVHNIVDRTKEKKDLKKRLKVEVKEIQTYPIDPSEYSELSDPDFTE